MKNIFVDMDGVLCDFEKRYRELFKTTPNEARSRSRDEYDKNWNYILDTGYFTDLDYYPGADELINFLNSLKFTAQVCILSSAGGFYRQRDIMEQKLYWLKTHKIDWPAVIVPGKQFKAGFADRNSIIIDDTEVVVTSFIENGGSAIHHKHAGETIEKLRSWLISSSFPFHK